MNTPLQFIAPLFAMFAAMIVGTERRLVRELRRSGALSPDTAAPLDVTMALRRWRLSRLMSQGVIRETSPGLHYLDEGGWKAYGRQRRKRVLIAVGTVIVLLVIFLR
jgi:hypothetical protein